jgi:hypothetical protein
VAESIYVRNKAWRRVMASDGKQSQRSAARKVARHGDFAYWNGLQVCVAKRIGRCSSFILAVSVSRVN